MVRYLSGGPGPTPHRGRSGVGMARGSAGSLAAAAGVGSGRGSSGSLVNVLQGVHGSPGLPRGKASAGKKPAAQKGQQVPAAQPPGKPPPATPIGVTPESFARSLLKTLGAPETTANINSIVAWEAMEGGHWVAGPVTGGTFNPLNTTQTMPGSQATNNLGGGQGVQRYTSWQQGLAATADTIRQSWASGIYSALKSGRGLGSPNSSLSSWSGGGYNQINLSLAPGYAGGPGGNISPTPGGIVSSSPAAGGAGGTAGRAAGPSAPPSRPSGSGQAITTAAPGGSADTSFPSHLSPPAPGGGLNPITQLLPGVGLVEDFTGAGTTVGDIGTAIANISNTLSKIIQRIDWLFVPNHWVRILSGIGGVAFTAAGIFQLSHTGSSVNVPAVGEVSYPRAVSLPLGIAMVGTGGILLFVAFHALPSTVETFPDFIGYITQEIQTGTSTWLAVAPQAPPTELAVVGGRNPSAPGSLPSGLPVGGGHAG